MKRRSLLGALAALGVLVLAVNSASAYSLGTATLEWVTQLNLSSVTGNWITRGMDIDQTNGDIYVACDLSGSRHIVKVPSGGSFDPETLTRYGPDLKDSGGATQLTLAATPWGVAIDPKTKDLYIATDVAGAGEVHVTDNAGVWKRKFQVGGSTARGCAFSDDGMKFAVAWYITQRPYEDGARLYTRNLQGTPADFTDDTWDLAASLASVGSFGGIGTFTPYVASTRDVCFDRNGDVYVAGGDNVLYKYSGTAPYPLVAELNYADRREVSRYNVDADANNIIYSVANSDGDGAIKRFWGVDQNGVPVIKIDVAENGSTMSNPYSIAYDRLNNRVLVAGRDTTGNYAELDSWSVTTATTPTIALSGRVTDSVSGNPIANAGVGYLSYLNASTWQTTVVRNFKKYSGMTNANGNYVVQVPVLDTAGANLPGATLISVNAPGYLSKRIHTTNIDAARTVDVALDPVGKASITWNPLQPMPGDTTGSYRVGEESGLFHHLARYGGRAQMVNDPAGGGFTVARIGASSSTSTTAPSGNALDTTDRSLDNYLNMNVDDAWYFAGQPSVPLWLTVEYLHNSDATTSSPKWDWLGLQGDFTDQDPAWWNIPIGEIFKFEPFTNTYMKRTFKVSQAEFSNKVRDTLTSPPSFVIADFRVTAHKDYGSGPYPAQAAQDFIKSVSVSKVAPSESNVYSSIAAAKQAGSGRVVLEDKVITGQWNSNVMYLEELDRSSGIKVNLFQPWLLLDLRLGRFAKVYGALGAESSGESVIVADAYSDDPFTVPGELLPLWANGNALLSPNNLDITAHKVGIAGKVVQVSAPAFFTVDDGYGEVKVPVDPSLTTLTWPGANDFVTVVGIAGLEGGSPASATRIVKPYAASNVVVQFDAP